MNVLSLHSDPKNCFIFLVQVSGVSTDKSAMLKLRKLSLSHLSPGLTTHPEHHQTATGPPPWHLRTARDVALLPADPARPATDENLLRLLRFKTSKNSTSFPRVFHELPRRCNILKHIESIGKFFPHCSTPLWADWIRKCTSTVKSVGTGQASALQRAFTISCSVSDKRILSSIHYPLYQSALAILSCSKTT